MALDDLHLRAPSLTVRQNKCVVICQDGTRCNTPPAKGSLYCTLHKGAEPTIKKAYTPTYYAQHLGPTLREALEEQINSPHHLQLQLYEELAVTRTAALEAVKLASILYEQDGDTGKTIADSKNIDMQTRVALVNAMRDSMVAVKEMVMACSKVEKDVEDKVSLRVIDLYLKQIMNCIGKALRKHPELVDAIQNEIEQTIRVPTARASAREIEQQYGDVMTPDKMVELMMQRTAPMPPDEHETEATFEEPNASSPTQP